MPELEIAARLEGNHHRRDDDQRTSYCETHSTAPVCSPLFNALAIARNNGAHDCACSPRLYNKLTEQNITMKRSDKASAPKMTGVGELGL